MDPGDAPGGGLEALQNMFQCIIDAGRKWDILETPKGKPTPDDPIILWTDHGRDRDYPEPDLDSIYANTTFKKASLLIMRYPTMYDEDTGFLLERYIWPALRLLFSQLNACFIS